MARTPDADGSRARRSGLTRQDVLTAALRLIDADGVDALSMRCLGRAGVCSPTADDWQDVLRRTARSGSACTTCLRGSSHGCGRWREPAAYDGAQELEEGLDVVLSGLRTLLTASRRRAVPSSTGAGVPTTDSNGHGRTHR